MALEMILGITASSSLMVAECMRLHVDEGDSDGLRAAEQRITSYLRKDEALDRLPDAYLKHAAPHARALRFRTVDGGDCSHPDGLRFENLDVVRDGSCKPRKVFKVLRKGTGRHTKQNPKRRTPRTRGTKKGKSLQGSSGHQGVRPAKRSRTIKREAKKKAEARGTTCPLHEKAPPLGKPSEPSALSVVRPPTNNGRTTGITSLPNAPTMNQGEDGTQAQERFKYPSYPALYKPGYWLIHVEAGDGNGKHLPLYADMFSTVDPAYLKLGSDAWNEQFRGAITKVLSHVGNHGVWLFDRGFDDDDWFNWLHHEARVEQSVIRVKKNRVCHPGTVEEEPVKLFQFVENLARKYQTQIRYVDKSSHKVKWRKVDFNWAPVHFKSVNHPLYAVVVWRGKRKPMVLLTDKRPETQEQAAEVIAAYYERWGNEEVTRLFKCVTGLETMRVRSMQGQRRLMWLALIAMGIQALLAWENPRLWIATVKRATELRDWVRFELYRIARVFRADVPKTLERAKNRKKSVPT